jgi:Uma2 family endonuclease
MSAEAFFAASLPDARTELVLGEVVRMTPAGGEHGVVAMRIGARLLVHAEAHGLGVVCAAETGFLIRREPDTVRAPDVAFVARERIPAGGPPKAFWMLAPDLAVEVVSPSERGEDTQQRIRDWLEAGVRCVWVIYPTLRTVHVLRSLAAARILQAGDLLSGEDVLPGFTCPVAELFL